MPKTYPQHERFKAQQDRMEAAQEFVEWFLEHGPVSEAYECGCCRADGRKPLSAMIDREKGDLIMECFGIDVKEFYEEKERMVQELREGGE